MNPNRRVCPGRLLSSRRRPRARCDHTEDVVGLAQEEQLQAPRSTRKLASGGKGDMRTGKHADGLPHDGVSRGPVGVEFLGEVLALRVR